LTLLIRSVFTETYYYSAYSLQVCGEMVKAVYVWFVNWLWQARKEERQTASFCSTYQCCLDGAWFVAV